jgi:hypothetical protein
MFLELHLAIEKIREEANIKHGCKIPKFLSDSKAICHVKKFMQIMKEKDSFDLLKYTSRYQVWNDDISFCFKLPYLIGG